MSAVLRWWRIRFPENPTMDTNTNDHEGVWVFLEGLPAMSTLDRLDDEWDPCIHFYVIHSNFLNIQFYSF